MSRAPAACAAVLSAALAAAPPAGALDYGLTLDSVSDYDGAEDDPFSQRARLSAWIDEPLGEHMLFLAEGSVTASTEAVWVLDSSRFGLSGRFPVERGPLTTWALDAGRIRLRDPSAELLDQTADGIALEALTRFAAFGLFAGYTGLLAKDNTTLLVSQLDSEERDDDSVYFAPPRLLAGASLTIPEVVARQAVWAAAIGQLDLRPKDDVASEGDTDPAQAGGGRVSTLHLGAGLSGPLAAGLYHDELAYVVLGRLLSYRSAAGRFEEASLLGVLAGAGLRYYREQPVGFGAGLRALFATGDDDDLSTIEGNQSGASTTFVPLSSASPALVFAPHLRNLAVVEANASLKPLAALRAGAGERLQLRARAFVFFRTSLGVLTEPGFVTSASSRYLGSEVDLILNARPTSDLGLSLSAGLFAPNSDTLARDVQGAARATASLRL